MKILVVEDDKKIAKFIKRGLEVEKYEADVVHDGEAGFQRVLDGAYTVIVSSMGQKDVHKFISCVHPETPIETRAVII